MSEHDTATDFTSASAFMRARSLAGGGRSLTSGRGIAGAPAAPRRAEELRTVARYFAFHSLHNTYSLQKDSNRGTAVPWPQSSVRKLLVQAMWWTICHQCAVSYTTCAWVLACKPNPLRLLRGKLALAG